MQLICSKLSVNADTRTTKRFVRIGNIVTEYTDGGKTWAGSTREFETVSKAKEFMNTARA